MRVDFADTDAGGVVYFGRYGRYLERAIIEYRRAAGLPLMGEPGHVFMVRSMGVDFHAPFSRRNSSQLPDSCPACCDLGRPSATQ